MKKLVFRSIFSALIFGVTLVGFLYMIKAWTSNYGGLESSPGDKITSAKRNTMAKTLTPFGTYEDKATNTEYQAPCDGYVIYSFNSSSSDNTFTSIIFRYGVSPTPATTLTRTSLRRGPGYYIDESKNASVPVPKGTYRKIEVTGNTPNSSSVKRLPAGNCS